MDGVKAAADTMDIRKDCGRQAFCKGRIFSVRNSGPCRNENPGDSRILDT
jgi:hypothetical protein